MNVKTHCAYLLVTCDDDKRKNIITQIEQMDEFKEIMEHQERGRSLQRWRYPHQKTCKNMSWTDSKNC